MTGSRRHLAFAWLALLPATGCGGESPPLPDAWDAGADSGFAPWPPRPGDAGLRLTWSVEATPPTPGSCEAADLDRVRLDLVHPLADFETWTAPELEGPCPAGQVALDPANGLQPGRYRFRATLLHGDGSPFQHGPAGQVGLVSGETAPAGHVDVSAAAPGDGGLIAPGRPPPGAALRP
jgi:hypothetical protein